MPMEHTTPWKTLKEAAVYARRGPRFLRREIEAGRLRAARVGGRREFITRDEWIDEWLEELSRPVMASRAGFRR
jgi:excisionase family DNA binding protein